MEFLSIKHDTSLFNIVYLYKLRNWTVFSVECLRFKQIRRICIPNLSSLITHHARRRREGCHWAFHVSLFEMKMNEIVRAVENNYKNDKLIFDACFVTSLTNYNLEFLHQLCVNMREKFRIALHLRWCCCTYARFAFLLKSGKFPQIQFWLWIEMC